MVQQRGYVVFMLFMMFMLSGCFRQASEPAEPLGQQSVSSTSAPAIDATPTLPVTPIPLEGGEGTAATEIPLVEAPTDVPVEEEPAETEELQIAVTESTPVPPPTDLVPSTLPPTAVIEPTADPGSGGSSDPVPLEAPTNTPVSLITPIGPQGNTAFSTPTVSSPSGITTATPSGLITPTNDPNIIPDECVYVVQPGDNLFRIAVNNNTTVDALRATNPTIVGDLIQPGDQLTLPGCVPGGQNPPPAEGDAMGTGSDDSGIIGDVGVGGVPGAGTQTVHVVQPGETLLVIARRYGVTIADIVAANNLADPNRLAVNQELIIPAPGN